MKIKKQLEIIIYMCYVYILFGIISLIGIFIYYKINVCNIQRVELIKPKIEKIIEYADNDPEIIKEPIDIIEESEEEIIEEIEEEVEVIISKSYPTIPLTIKSGKVQGPQEIETYYNLPMDLVVEKMRNLGYTELDYPYYIREDGVKMLGDFIIVAADLNVYPKGTIVQTSLGQGMVCDTYTAEGQLLDLAVNW